MTGKLAEMVYMIRRVNLVRMWHGKAVIFVKHNCLNIYVFSTVRAILPRKCFGQRDRKVIERGDGMLRKTKCRVPQQSENIDRPRDVHRKL